MVLFYFEILSPLCQRQNNSIVFICQLNICSISYQFGPYYILSDLKKKPDLKKDSCPYFALNFHLRQCESKMRHLFAGGAVASWVSSSPKSTVASRASSLSLKYCISLLCLWQKLVHREWSRKGVWGSQPLLRSCQLQMRNFILLESLFR